MGSDASPRDRILEAAVAVFSERSLAETSMAAIAEAAGMSRPALYQYFEDKHDIYHSMLGRILDRSAEGAIGALAADGPLSVQLDGFLQRSWADEDIWRLSHHQGPDLTEAKAGAARPLVDAHFERLTVAMGDHLQPRAADREQLEGWLDLIRFAPIGFKHDQPSLAAFRRRLRSLATTLADTIVAARVTT